MAKMTVMEAVIKIMEDEGVEVVFGIPGVAKTIRPCSGSSRTSRSTGELEVR